MVSFSTPTFLSRKTATSLLKSSSSAVSFAILSLCSFEKDWGSLKPAHNFRCFGSFSDHSREKDSVTTASPGSKYEHRRTSALLRHIRNIRICMGKKPIVSVTCENERISIKKKQLVLHKMCVTSLLCRSMGRFMAFLCVVLKRCSFCRCSYFELGLPVILRDLLE